MRDLFISFSGLLHNLIDNNPVSQEDLDTGLFYFGCIREIIFSDNYAKYFIRTPELYKNALERIQKAVLLAEQQHRCIWRTESENHSYTQLNYLLITNGYFPIYPKSQWEIDYLQLPNVAEKMPSVNPTLKVIYR